MSILDSKSIIRGVKPLKEQPKFGNDEKLGFDKTMPIHAHNFPLTKWTVWKIYGYKKDQYGFKRPFWLKKKLPTGKAITPQMCGLDGFFDIKPMNQVI